MFQRIIILSILIITTFGALPGTVNADNPSLQPCDGFVSRLTVNTQARWVLDGGGNLRNSPSRDGNGIATVSPGDIVNILDGPRCVGGYTWWLVRHNETQGWIPEGRSGEYWMAPATNRGLTVKSVPNILSRVSTSVQFNTSNWQGFPEILSRNSCVGRTGLGAYTEDGRVNRVDNGTTVTLNPNNIIGSLPIICTNQPVERATAFGPSGGAVNAAIYRGQNGNTAVTLPLSALANEGTWRLDVNNYGVVVNVPSFSRPQVITEPSYLSATGESSLLLGGFAPFQRVALVTMQPSEALPQAYEVQTDGTGQWYGRTFDECLECIQAVVGESGQSLVRHPVTLSGETLSQDETNSLLYATLWNAGRLQNRQCDAVNQTQLRIAGRAETAANTETVIKSDTGIFGNTVGYITPNSPVKLLYGPVCEDGSTWWLVDYEGTVGWTNEAQGQTYLMEPFVPTTTCSNNWFFTLEIEEPNCPGPVQTSRAAGHDFEGGRVYWYQNPPVAGSGQGTIFVIYNDGTWETFADTYNPDIHPSQDDNLRPPEGLFQPERGIGLIWRNNPRVRERLGWAYEPEYLFEGRYQLPDVNNPSYFYIDHGARETVLKLNTQNFTWIVAGQYRDQEQ